MNRIKRLGRSSIASTKVAYIYRYLIKVYPQDMHVNSSGTLLSILVLMVYLTSCDHPEKSTDPLSLKRIEVSPDPTKFTLSQIVDSIQFVVLETDPDALIGTTSKLLVTDSAIYVMENYQRKSVLAFNRQGDFLYRVGRQGKGPGEFTDLDDICINKQNQCVVSDFSGKKILFFDNHGAFIREIKPTFYPSKIGCINNDLYVVTSYFPNSLINILSMGGTSTPVKFKDDPDFRSYDHTLRESPQGFYFQQYLDDTVYKIDNEEIKPCYLVDFGERKMGRSAYLKYPLNPIDPSLLRLIPAGIRYGPLNFIENDKFIAFIFFQSTVNERDIQFCIFDKRTDKAIFTEMNLAFDDLFALHKWMPIIGYWKDKFVMKIDAYLFLKKYEVIRELFSLNKPEYLPALEKVKNSITEDSNPILVFASFHSL
jgi:hypothetical protein